MKVNVLRQIIQQKDKSVTSDNTFNDGDTKFFILPGSEDDWSGGEDAPDQGL